MIEDNKTILVILNLNNSDQNVLSYDMVLKKGKEINIKAEQFIISSDKKLAIFYGKNCFSIYEISSSTILLKEKLTT